VQLIRKHGKQHQRKHLYQCLNKAREREDEDREKEILAIIQREKDRSFWRRLNYVMGKPRTGSVRRVLVENGDQEGMLTEENTTQESVQQGIFDNIHRKQFFLVEAAPICTGRLRGQFGYYAVTRTAKAILKGLYVYPEDFNQARKEIFLECAHIRGIIPKDSLNTTITKEEWRGQWKGQRESTSSLELGLHFGHYIAGCGSDHISYFHALKATLIMKQGVVLER
jgi:hypothetical protein